MYKKFSKNKLRKWLDKNGILLILGASVGYALLFSTISVWKYSIFAYNGIDLAYFSQVFWNTLQGKFFVQTIHPHLSLGDHAGLLIPLLTPLYALFPDPRNLLTLQSIALALPAWPIYLIAKQRLGSLSSPLLRAVLPIFFGGAWLMSPIVQNINLFEFHLLPFALAPLFFAMLAYEKENKWFFLVMCAIALLVREDVALVVFMIGALAWIEKKPLWWRIVPALVGATWFLFTMRLISHFSISSGYKFLIYYSWLGDSVQAILIRVVTRPDIVLAHILTLANFEMVLGFGLPLLFLSFVKPKRLILAALPLLQIIMGSAGGGELILQTHYAVLFLPAIFLAGIEGARMFHELELKIPLPAIDRRKLLMLILTLSMVYSMFIIGPLPGVFTKLFYSDEYKGRVLAAEKLVEQIPATSSVAASYSLLPHLANRNELYSIHYHFIGRTQFGTSPYSLPPSTDVIAFDKQDLLFYATQFPQTGWAAPYYASGYGNLLQIAGEATFIKDDFVLYNYIERPGVSIEATVSTIMPKGNISGTHLRSTELNSALYRIGIQWSAAIPTASDKVLVITFFTENRSVAYSKTVPLPMGIVTDMRRSSTDISIEMLPKGIYTPVITIEKQEAQLQLDSIRSTKRAVLDREVLQRVAMPLITVQ